MPERRSPGHKSTLSVPVTTALKTALELEAWECQQSLPEYIRGLLMRRGKYFRTYGKVRYDIAAEIPGMRRMEE
jgi:hypothetical protein